MLTLEISRQWEFSHSLSCAYLFWASPAITITNLGQKGLCSSMWVELGVTHNVTSRGRAPVPDIKLDVFLLKLGYSNVKFHRKWQKTKDHPRFRNSPKCWKDQETRGSSSAYLWTHDNHCRTCTIAWSLLCTVSPSILFTSWHLLQVMNQPRRPFSWVQTLKQSKSKIIRGLRCKPLSTSSSNKSGKPLPRWQYWVNLHLQGSLQLQAHQGIICRQLWQREALPARQLRVLEGQELHRKAPLQPSHSSRKWRRNQRPRKGRE